jgi:hypothetical protein
MPFNPDWWPASVMPPSGAGFTKTVSNQPWGLEPDNTLVNLRTGPLRHSLGGRHRRTVPRVEINSRGQGDLVEFFESFIQELPASQVDRRFWARSAPRVCFTKKDLYLVVFPSLPILESGGK